MNMQENPAYFHMEGYVKGSRGKSNSEMTYSSSAWDKDT